MPNVVFCAPFLLETTLRFVQAVVDQPGARVALVTQEPAEAVPAAVREKLAHLVRSTNALDAATLTEDVRLARANLGPVHRLLGALEELQVPLGEVRKALGIPGMDGATARNFRDKARMKEILRANGLPCARYRRVRAAADAEAFAKEVGFPLIVKPTEGSGARNTYRVEDATQLRETLALGAKGGETLLEEFVRGDEASFDSVFRRGKLEWFSTCHYIPSPLEVLENRWVQWRVIIPREAHHPRYHDIAAVAERALQALGMEDGLSHLEWFRRPDGSLAISEVGARPPGAQFVSLISYAHATDMYQTWARLMVHGEFDPPARPYAAGAAFLRGQGRGRVVAIHGVRETVAKIADLTVEIRLPPEGATRRETYEGDGWVIVRHPRTEVVEQALAKIVRTIRVELG
jgi:formate-dependent phosphoribosylglycinamide formyltransferase (GAR transformylase)